MLPEAPRAGFLLPLTTMESSMLAVNQNTYVVPSPLKTKSWEIKSQPKLITALGKLSCQPRTAKLLEHSFEGKPCGRFPRLPPFCEIVGGCQAHPFVGSNQSNLITAKLL